MKYAVLPYGEYISSAQSGYNTYSPLGLINADYPSFTKKTVLLKSDSNNMYFVKFPNSYYSTWSSIFNITIPDNRPIELIGALLSSSSSEVFLYRLADGAYLFERHALTSVIAPDGKSYYMFPYYSSTGNTSEYPVLSLYFTGYFNGIEDCNSVEEAISVTGITSIQIGYPINYHYTNSTVSGPSSAAAGDIVTVSAVPDVGYGITDASTQILVTNNDVAVPYTWDAANQRITFTMPDPS